MTSQPYPHIDSWSAAESLAVGWMREHGYPDAHATMGGADGGVDARATGALAQVKFRGAMTGRPVLHSLVGARGRGVEQLLCFSGTGFSAPAVTYADELDIALFTFNPAGVMTPLNTRARALTVPPRPTEHRHGEGNPDATTSPGLGTDGSVSVARYFFGLVLAVGTIGFVTRWVQTSQINNAQLNVLLFMTVGAVLLLWPALRSVYRGVRWLFRRRDNPRQ